MEAEELRIALEATRTVEDLNIEGRALAEQLQPIEEYAATPAENLSPWLSKLGSTSISNRALCLLPIAVRAEIAHVVPQLHPTSRYLLALIYMPGSSVTNEAHFDNSTSRLVNEDHFDNSTSRLVIEPILGRNYYTVKFLDLSIPVNFVGRSLPGKVGMQKRRFVDGACIIAFKEEHGLAVDLFVGGPDAKAALKVMLRGFAQVGSLSVFVRTNPLGYLSTVTFAEYHPSYGIMSRKPKVQVSIRDHFCLYKVVCTVGNLARSCCQPILTEKVIMAELSEEHHRRLQVMKENIIVLAEFLQGNPDRIREVMNHFPSINYNGVKWAIATVTHLEEKSGRPVTIAERGFGKRNTTYTRWNMQRYKVSRNT